MTCMKGQARRRSRVVRIGSVSIGGSHPVLIQSMTKTKTSCAPEVIAQIRELEKAGCEIIRVSVKDPQDAAAIRQIRPRIRIPLVADIHFDYRLALAAIEAGADKIRLNPGNMYKQDELAQVVGAAKAAHIPIRVGLNSGSVRDHGSRKTPMHKRLAQSAIDYIRRIEKLKFRDIVVSLKGSTIFDTTLANREFAGSCDYPLHLGVTATGAPYSGAIKSSIALGMLLFEGIGDTIRVSLTDTSIQEIKTARAVLEAVDRRHFGPQIISCPTCGRCEVDVVGVVKELEKRFADLCPDGRGRPARVAVMGCVVNGPGEAREADMGVAFGKSEGVLFKSGKAVKKISSKDCVDVILRELKRGRGHVTDTQR